MVLDDGVGGRKGDRVESEGEKMQGLKRTIDNINDGGKLFKVLDKAPNNNNWYEDKHRVAGADNATDEDIDFLVSKGLIKETGRVKRYNADNVIYEKA